MRRCLILFLLVLLPFQFAWAGAVSYCTHEQDKGVQHFGHHEHRHISTLAKTMGDGSDDVSDDHQAQLHGDSDPDCGYCHLGCAQPLATVVPTLAMPQPPEILVARLSPPRSSLFANTIERPNWTRLAL